MGQNRDLFRSDFSPAQKFTEIWSEKGPALSHFGPIWPTLSPNLTPLMPCPGSRPGSTLPSIPQILLSLYSQLLTASATSGIPTRIGEIISIYMYWNLHRIATRDLLVAMTLRGSDRATSEPFVVDSLIHGWAEHVVPATRALAVTSNYPDHLFCLYWQRIKDDAG